jgi:hypothetical protein
MERTDFDLDNLYVKAKKHLVDLKEALSREELIALYVIENRV